MKARATGSRSIRMEMYNSETFAANTGLREVVRQIRQGVTGDDCAFLEGTDLDSITRHVIGYVGDMPVASARWRCVQCSDSRSFGVIEKLCVLEGYRLRGIGKLLLRKILQIPLVKPVLWESVL